MQTETSSTRRSPPQAPEASAYGAENDLPQRIDHHDQRKLYGLRLQIRSHGGKNGRHTGYEEGSEQIANPQTEQQVPNPGGN